MTDPKRPSLNSFSINLGPAESNQCQLTINLPWEIAEELFVALSEHLDAREISQRQGRERVKAREEQRARQTQENLKTGKLIQEAVEASRAKGVEGEAAWRDAAGAYGVPLYVAKFYAGVYRNRKRARRDERITQLVLGC